MQEQNETTILVAEDDPPLRTLMARMLQSSGFSVIEAPNGAAALEAVKRHGATIRLTITDVVMPHMDGFALSERVRQINPDARVLLISGEATDSIAVRGGLKESGEAFLLKPFSREALAAKVGDMLAGESGGDRAFPHTSANPIRRQRHGRVAPLDGRAAPRQPVT